MHAKDPPTQPTTFADAFRFSRTKYGYSYSDVSRLVGQNKDTIRDWETGKSFPRGRDIPRLCSIMRELRPYVRLIPRQHDDTEEDKQGVQVASATVPPGPPPPLPPAPAPPTTFQEALRQARLDAGLNQAELGELMGVHNATISAWEKSISVPVRVNYDKLLDLLPGLKEGPVPDIQDINPPVGLKNKGVAKSKPSSTKSVTPMKTGLEPEPTLFSTLPVSEDKVSSPPISVSLHKNKNPDLVASPQAPFEETEGLAFLAVAWSQALVRCEAAQFKVKDCRAALKDAEQELATAQDDIERTHRAVNMAAVDFAAKGRK